VRPQQKAKRFAKMFLNTVGIDAVPKALDELLSINGLIGKSREFRGLLENPLFAGDEREKVMKELEGKLKLSNTTLGFVRYLSEQRMIHALPDVIHLLTALFLEKKKRAKATVVTPVDTNRKYDAVLTSSLKKLTGRDIDIDYVIDPSLLGGILIKVGSTMYDSSIKGQLGLLKDDLLKR